MTLREAREILEIGPDDDPRPLMDDLRMARETLAAMVRDAPNQGLAMRHQEELVRFDKALAAVRETLEALGLEESPPDAEDDEEEDETPEASRRSTAGPGASRS